MPTTDKLLKAAYVDHEFHIKTSSTVFMRNILKKHFDITEFWETSWHGTPCKSLPELLKEDYDIIFFFQVIPKLKDLKKLTCKNIIWIPMADHEITSGLHEKLCYLKYNIRIICFCKALYDHYTAKGFTCQYIQYFLKPEKQVKPDKNRVLAWIRSSVVDWRLIKQLIPESCDIVLKSSPDPGEKVCLPTEEDYQKYNIKLVEGWLEKEEYEEIIDSCNIFIAPRKLEGIGLSILETMARGMCVIASNTPTMNEYVQHGKTGFLFDLNKPEKLDMSNVPELCNNMHTYNTRKYDEWLNCITDIIDFIKESPSDFSKKQLFFNTIEFYIKAPIIFCQKAFGYIMRKITG